MNAESNEKSATLVSKNTNVAQSAAFDLAQPSHRAQLAAKIVKAIDAYCVEAYDDGHRTHLGASLIGRECSRFLWYTFRWVKHVKNDGRTLRLFNRGHREEDRFIEWLEGVGATVSNFDGDVPMTLFYHAESDSYFFKETSKVNAEDFAEGAVECDYEADVGKALQRGVYPDYPQHRVSGCGGHFGGSIDALVTLPASFGVPGDLVFINEYKTSGTGAKFNNMLKNGVQQEKYEHFCQMSMYGWKRGIRYGLYMMINKNDDSLHVEIVELDWALAQRLEAKADRIIQSPRPPEKISQTITFQACSYCDMKDVCHQGAEYERNCRSCASAQPTDNKGWYCHTHKGPIPIDFIPKGCASWNAAV